MPHVHDTELTVHAGRINLHMITPEKVRLTDGIRHPVKVIKPAKHRLGRSK